MLVDKGGDLVVDEVTHRCGQILVAQNLVALGVDRLALFVDDVVVLDDALADVEVVALDARLGELDRPAWATMGASFSWNLALSTSCLMPRRLSSSDSTSLFSTLVVPTSTGRPASVISTTSSIRALNLAFSVRYTRSASSSRTIG